MKKVVCYYGLNISTEYKYLIFYKGNHYLKIYPVKKSISHKIKINTIFI
ncbi:MAG: Unknown protein [uncultured Sulfurovum sp.]|uniref:Uncharacterized protein n=1 Tax=uncultured Sulfurovum sp. TaxID=269237 RepID=A0A6S6T1H8_9BACT|nr:MAG: Unknown protein [uncultured Sulfurovum sp.]